jgi:shikimate kinase
MFILDDILLSPLKGLTWIAQKIDEVANKEFTDVDQLMDKLMELQLRFELDEIDVDEYNKLENELLERLDAIREEENSDEQ